jgi:predicted nucleic-acid-binding protein
LLIIVRLLVNDNAEHYKKAYGLFEKHEIFIADTVILEMEWVLRFTYDFNPDQIASALTKLLGLPNIHVNHPSLVAQAISGTFKGLILPMRFIWLIAGNVKLFSRLTRK